jgi:hypothetical protein
MGVKTKKTDKIHVDNIGYIFLPKNKTSGEKTKQIDMKYHFIREHKFVGNEQNYADLFTKNLGSALC